MLAYFDKQLWDSTLPSDEHIANFKNKKLLIVNVGGPYKYHLMKRIRAIGVGHVVVLGTPDDWYSKFVDDTIDADSIRPLTDPENPESDERIQAIRAYMEKKSITFDGVWTFADDSVVLTAQLAEYLGTPGIDPKLIAQLINKIFESGSTRNVERSIEV